MGRVLRLLPYTFLFSCLSLHKTGRGSGTFTLPDCEWVRNPSLGGCGWIICFLLQLYRVKDNIEKSHYFYWNLFLIDFLPICSVFFLTFLTLQDFRMHLTATGKLGRSLTIIIKMDQMMLFWLTNSWYKQATEQSPLTSARYCIRVHTGLYRNAQVIRSGERWKKHVIVPFSSLRIEIPELHHSVWSCWLC